MTDIIQNLSTLAQTAKDTSSIRQLQLKQQRLYEQLIAAERDIYSKNFEAFCKAAWQYYLPGRPLIWNWHMSQICHVLQLVADGEITGWVIITVPPRSSKSSIVSVLFPAFLWTRTPHIQIVTFSHSERFSIRDAVNTRMLLMNEWYQQRWGHVFQFTDDQNQKHRYTNSARGHRIAFGLRQSITGEGGDVLIIDDPLDAKDVYSDVRRQTILDSIDQTLPTRLNDMNTGVKLMIMQRIHEEDPAGHVINMFKDEIVHLNIPMRYEGEQYTCKKLGLIDPRTEMGELLDTNRFNEKNVKQLEAALGEYGAASQLQQRPAPIGGGLVKRKWWHGWVNEDGEPQELPEFEEIMISIDGAYTEREVGKNEAFDPKRSQSAVEVWGTFRKRNVECLMLIDAWMDWVDYPTFKRKVYELIVKHNPDVVVVEKKASGISLIQDLRRAQIPIVPYNPDRSKIARVYACQPAFEAGLIWYYPTPTTSDVIHQFTTFPKAKLNDAVDAGTIAILRFVRSRLIIGDLGEDVEEDNDQFMQSMYNNSLDNNNNEGFW